MLCAGFSFTKGLKSFFLLWKSSRMTRFDACNDGIFLISITHRRAVVVPSSCRTVVVQQMVSKINVNRSEKGIMRLNRREKMSSNVRYRYIRLKMIHFFRFQYYRVPVIFEFGRKKPDSGQKIASMPTTNNNATTSRYRDTHHSPY